MNGADDGEFVAILFQDEGGEYKDGLCLQYSVDAGLIGIDWVLLSPGNIAEADQFKSLISKEGYSIEEFEMNDVRYLRVEGQDLADLGKKVLRAYGVKRETPLGIAT